MLDYDGTLAPFQVDRMRAFPYPGVEARLERIDRGALVIVTGRSARDLLTLIPFARRLELWASHGREHLTAKGEYQFFEVTAEQSAQLAAVESGLNDASVPPSAVERKPTGLAVHWRGRPVDEQHALPKLVAQLYTPLKGNPAIELLPFEDGLELRATGRTKGDAVQAVLASRASSCPVAYLGDDLTDEDAFAALRPGDLGLLVRQEPRATLASHWLRPPEELLSFLDDWISAAGESQRSATRSD
jgi:trehalose-phosphatase